MKNVLKNLAEPIETTLNCLGIAVGVAEIETILGIILLVLNISILAVKGILRMVAWYKKAHADGKITEDEINEAINILEDTKDKIDKTKGE